MRHRKNAPGACCLTRKFAEEAQTWMQEQRASAYVKILDGNAQ